MPITAPTGAVVWGDYNVNGVPSSGVKNMKKSEARAWAAWLESFVTAIGTSGGGVYLTRAQLFADLQHAENDSAWVLQDDTVDFNGIYRKVGASGTGYWTRVADLPYSVIIAEDAGTGTANAIQATSSQPISATSQVWLTVSTTNTGSPVTVSFNGGSPLTIKTNSGSNPVAGGIVGGSILIGKQEGTTFRLASDQASAAIQAAMETIFGDFQSQYLGSYATAPAADPNGNPLQEGAYYWNTASNAHFYWDGTAYQGFPFATMADGTVTDAKLSTTLRNRVTIDGGTLAAIHSSRAVGEPVFMGNGLVDGFGGDAGINAGASSGYVLDPSNGRVMNAGNPIQQASVWDIGSLSSNASGWIGYTVRQRLEAPRIVKSGTKFRLRFKGGPSGATFSAVYAGHAGSAASFNGSQVAVTFAGGSSTLTLSANEAEWSDWMTYTLTAGTAFLVAGQCTAGGSLGRVNPTDADFTFYRKAASAEAATTVASGYTASANDLLWLEAIEVEQPSTIENIVLVTAPFEFTDFAPTQLKVSGIIEALDALTLNTDVTVEMSRDGGANWTAATMTQLKALGPKTYFETNIVSVTGQPAGDDIAVRYKTLNQKRCYLHGQRTEVNA
ncbi:hypothetical protein HFO09_07760 [Rhizobium laguerreae]|uniref:hypothetical protein n=1 Tax=Rhizobium laguerreae TaxID=1076926 RepID=UPI001C902C6B|nr:hypothetical protein [Rhizobium laguerreae]MBY3255587.1 hypothetical protein [Rhizobium laguerreae]MBY3282626.1 hypothetical protein [Rhizobium laguerreae]MBY3288980.1 hypothetical protein [Rhizobium laguerreae]